MEQEMRSESVTVVGHMHMEGRLPRSVWSPEHLGDSDVKRSGSETLHVRRSRVASSAPAFDTAVKTSM